MLVGPASENPYFLVNRPPPVVLKVDNATYHINLFLLDSDLSRG